MTEQHKTQPILIIGLGAAGASCAIFLALRGFKVTAVDRKLTKEFKVGESLSPDIKKILLAMDLWNEFQTYSHKPCYSNQSFWGSDIAEFHDFLQHPMGHGWHIDRPAFDQMLVEKAKKLGVLVIDNTSVISADYKQENNHWNVALKEDSSNNLQHLSYSFIVDATGRSRWLSRRQGIDKLYEDDQLALVAFLQQKNTNPLPGQSLIETTKNGWWYSAEIPHQRIVTSFLCTPDKEQRKQWLQPENWWKLISSTAQTSKNITPESFQLLETPKFVAADSGVLESVIGQGWLAVGDAAMTYDPIASHGIVISMASARQAAVSIDEYLNGNPEALEDYSQLVYWSFQQYSEERQLLYKAEQRFTESHYWNTKLMMASHAKAS
jgi:flavin-dependent dehydrogenase